MYIFVCLLLTIFFDALAIPVNKIEPLNEANEEEKNETDVDGDALLKEIKDLERQRNNLYEEINKAIDDSIMTLSKSNDTDAVTGVNYIKDLKKQIKELNDTEDTANVIYNIHDKRINTSDLGADKTIFSYKMENGSFVYPRRNMRTKHNKKGTPIERTSVDLGERYLSQAQKELERLLNKGLTGEKLKKRLERRERIKEQLEEWIMMKDRENKKIKEYREHKKKRVKYDELCPRNGYSKLKKKYKKGDHGCCRKCCKRSYLGCLKK